MTQSRADLGFKVWRVLAVVGGELGTSRVGERPPVLAAQADQGIISSRAEDCNRDMSMELSMELSSGLYDNLKIHTTRPFVTFPARLISLTHNLQFAS